jgi:hypothetical protein
LKAGLAAAVLFGASLVLVHFFFNRQIVQAALVGMAAASAMSLLVAISVWGQSRLAARGRSYRVLIEWPDQHPWAFAALSGLLLGFLSAVLSAASSRPTGELLALAFVWGFGAFLSFGLTSKLRRRLRARR